MTASGFLGVGVGMPFDSASRPSHDRAGAHHDPEFCWRCNIPLELFNGGDLKYPLPTFICPTCRVVVCCACPECEAKVAAAYGL